MGIKPEPIDQWRHETNKIKCIRDIGNGLEKRCSHCRKWLPATTEHFYPSGHHVGGVYNYCRSCNKKIKRITRKKVPIAKPDLSEILRLYESGERIRDIGMSFGLSHQTILNRLHESCAKIRPRGGHNYHPNIMLSKGRCPTAYCCGWEDGKSRKTKLETVDGKFHCPKCGGEWGKP